MRIGSADEFNIQFLILENDENEYDRRAKITKQFVENNIGATEKIISAVTLPDS